jgi:hypothetical protein
MRVFGLVSCLFTSRSKLLNTENFARFYWNRKKFSSTAGFIFFCGNINFTSRCQQACCYYIIRVCRTFYYCGQTTQQQEGTSTVLS